MGNHASTARWQILRPTITIKTLKIKLEPGCLDPSRSTSSSSATLRVSARSCIPRRLLLLGVALRRRTAAALLWIALRRRALGLLLRVALRLTTTWDTAGGSGTTLLLLRRGEVDVTADRRARVGTLWLLLRRGLLLILLGRTLLLLGVALRRGASLLLLVWRWGTSSATSYTAIWPLWRWGRTILNRTRARPPWVRALAPVPRPTGLDTLV